MYISLSDKLKEQFPEVDFGVIPGINDPEDPQSRTNFAVFMSSLIIGMIWITYITFFNSRAVGRIVTSIANRFVKVGYIKVSTVFTIFLREIKRFLNINQSKKMFLEQ